MKQFPNANTDASLRNYAEFVRNLPVAICRVTVEGKIVFCNEAFVRIFGFESIQDAIGYPIIKLYRNKKDRGILVQTVLRRGCINDIPIALTRIDGSPIWGSVTTKAIIDDDGVVIFLDSSVRDVTGEIEDSQTNTTTCDELERVDRPALVLDAQGGILEANSIVARILGPKPGQLAGKSFTDFLIAEDKQLFFMFLGDLIKVGREEVILQLHPIDNRPRYVKLRATVHKNEGCIQKISCIIDDVTTRIHQLQEKYNRQKFQGVLEMAGGVAHRFNQPLTIVTNIINEVLSTLAENDPSYPKIARAHDQIQRMNEISRKIGNIKKYEAVDYVAGVKIVDIDKAS
ncbi:MAG: PAS domain-containing protein [Desulfosarcina sp.]|nr:PAS domain-containing protein [Desulfobacterales bacterium]